MKKIIIFVVIMLAGWFVPVTVLKNNFANGLSNFQNQNHIQANINLSKYNLFESEGYIPSLGFRVFDAKKIDSNNQCVDYNSGKKYDRYYVKIQTFTLLFIPYYTKTVTCENIL